MRRKYVQRRRRHRLRLVFFFLMFCFGLSALWSEKQLARVQPDLYEAVLSRKAETVIAKAVPQYLEQLSVQTDGKVLLPDTYALSEVKAELTTALQRKLSGKTCVWIPAGSLTGIMLLNGHGPKVPVVLSVESAVQVTFETDMEAVGINRTRYGLCLSVFARLYSFSVSVPCSTTVETIYPVYEAVLEGEVPQVVTGFR